MLSKRLSKIFLTGPSGVAIGRIKKVMPRSSACATTASVPSSSSVQSCMVPGLPKLMHPTQIFDMLMPVLPSCVYCMMSPLGLPWCWCNHAGKFESVEVYLSGSCSSWDSERVALGFGYRFNGLNSCGSRLGRPWRFGFESEDFRLMGIEVRPSA